MAIKMVLKINTGLIRSALFAKKERKNGLFFRHKGEGNSYQFWLVLKDNLRNFKNSKLPNLFRLLEVNEGRLEGI